MALNHTAELSTPQQVHMAFFSLFVMTDKENRYKNLTKNIYRRSQKRLFDRLGIEIKKDPFSVAYYTQFDFLEWASQNYVNELQNT
jgi:aspartate 4-decarboxylase